MRENGRRRAVLYARVSTEEQTKGYSLRQQLEALRTYVASEGYEVVEECEDPGYSGMFLDRPGLEAASCECYRVIREEYERVFG